MKNLYAVINKPCLTEKSMGLQEDHNQVVMKVDSHANKLEIKAAVEILFKVKVEKVRTSNVHGKEKRVGVNLGRRSDWKKAFVTLDSSSKIDFLETL